MLDLFDDPIEPERPSGAPATTPVMLRGFALRAEAGILGELDRVTAAAPFRHMVTPGGYRMSVAMTNCGTVGWVTGRDGYRYAELDRASGRRWPPMSGILLDLATTAADRAGFTGF